MGDYKIYSLVRPRSLTNADYEAYEYLIRWVGRDGADYQYMFYDAEIQHKVRNETINEEDAARIEAIVSKETRSITLTADDLSKNDLTIIGSLFSNRYVTRLLKDGTTERYAPQENSLKYRLMQGRYKIEFDLNMANLAVWK